MNSYGISQFDAAWYVDEYPDVEISGLKPLEHFRKIGALLGRMPCAQINSEYTSDMADQRVGLGDDIHLAIVPTNELMQIGGSSWRSLGTDPFFIVDLNRIGSFSIGWYSFSLSLKIKGRRGVAKFYLDCGSGFSEKDVVTIPYQSGECVQRFFHVDGYVDAIRFDPKEFEGEFDILELSVKYCSEEYVKRKMAERLREVKAIPGLWSEGGVAVVHSFESHSGSISGVSPELLDAYNATFEPNAERISYEQWMEAVEFPILPSKLNVSQRLNELTARPIISIVVPVYNTPEKYLRACIDSVLRQSYPYWELCIADDNSPNHRVRAVLREYLEKDRRVKVAFRDVNGHISEASNSALELASGDYVALLDHDDELAEHALLFMAEAIQNNSAAKVLYSDEDKITESGERFDPHFKSDWNPDLFYSQNYVSHLGLYDRNLIEKVNGFRVGVEGSQDQDLLLRCLAHITDEQIVHVPRVLYHWRTIEGSTALSSDGKSYTQDAGVKALTDHFVENGQLDVAIERGLAPNSYRVKWPILKPEPLVSLLIPTRDKKDVTEVAIRSIIEKSTYKNFEIIIIDNGSVEPETLLFFDEIQKEDGRVRVLRYDHPFNYSAINNYGFKHAKGQLIGLVNNDVEVINGEWLSEMVSHALRPDIGCVGAKLYYGNGTIQHAGVITSLGGVAGHSHKNFPGDHPGYFFRLKLVQNLSAVTAACLIVRREIYEEVDGLNETDLTVAFNDVDFCLKVRKAGYRNVWTPYAELFHHESVSRGVEDNPEKVARFGREVAYMKNTWPEWVSRDEYYSPNLTRDREDFSIARV